MSFAAPLFDKIAADYSLSKQLPFRRVESYTFMNLVSNTLPAGENLRVLDLACGDGFYTRMLAAGRPQIQEVVGVDISDKMVNLARTLTPRSEHRLRFLHSDAADLAHKADFTERFDLVCCTYLLNYATSEETLTSYVRVLFDVLRPNAWVIGINDNPNDDPANYDHGHWSSLGLEKTLKSGKRVPYCPVYYKCGMPPQLEIENRWIPAKTYEAVFAACGFHHFQWIDLQAPFDDSQSDAVRNFVDMKPLTCFKAIKPSNCTL